MGFQTQPFTLNDFSGGITDNFINGPPNRSEKVDNLYIMQNKSLLSREGSAIDDTTNDVIPGGAARIGTLINYNNSEKLFVQSDTNIFYRNTSAYTTLVGPVTSNDVFSAGSTSSYVSHTQWNRHLFLTNDSFAIVQKIYKDGASVYQVRTAGLPKYTLAPTIAQANLTKTGNTTNGSEIITSMSSVTGIDVGMPISGTGIPAGATIVAVGTTTITMSAQATATNASVALTFTGVRSYVYTFHYYYTYTIGTQIFEDFGSTYQKALDNAIDPSIVNVSITGLDAIVNSTTNNYDTATIKIYIYRTLTDETTGFKTGQVTNGTTTFTDSSSDTTIETALILYTTGGVLDNDPPPLAKFIHVTNNIGYFAHIKDGAEVKPNAYRSSVAFDPDSCPEVFEDEVEDEITGLSSVQSLPIVLCKRHIYRVEGAFDEFGRGSMNHVRISDTAGCVSNASLVQAENGLFWAGNDGFYYTDGYRVLKISDHLNDTYQGMLSIIANAKNITGIFDEKNRRIIWAAQSDSSSLDNDMCFVLELRWGISEESAFTTISGGDDFAPTSLAFFSQSFYRADKRGYVFLHSDSYLTDPIINTSVNAASWNTRPIVWDFKSTISNLGVADIRKWVPKIILTARNRSNVSIQINVINDYGRITRQCTPIRWRQNIVWEDAEFIWGEPTCAWTAEGLIEEMRWLPAGGLRLSYIQVQVTNAYIIITNSDTLGTATFDTTAKTATLDGAATFDWPSTSIGYYLSQVDDSYDTQLLVTSKTSDVLTYSDIANASTAGSMDWLLQGVRKDEILNLLSLTLLAAPISRSIKTYESGEDGANT